MATPTERFWAKVNKDGPVPGYRPDLGPCWLWTAATDRRGYGRFDQRQFGTPLAHRAAFLLSGRVLDPELTLDHLCRVRACVRPDHLEQVTTQVNTSRTPFAVLAGRQPRKQACGHGHEFTPANTRVDPRGSRHCRTCDAAAKAKRSAQRAAARVERYGFDPGPHSRKRANLQAVLART